MAEVDTWEYLNDVLVRIDTHPAREIEDLKPMNWKKKFSQASRVEKNKK